MSDKDIFSEFNEVSAKAWKQKIQMDLKGADYNKSLLSSTLDDITIQPFYHNDTYKSLEIPASKNTSNICQTIFINDERIVNNISKEAINKGAEAIRFIASKPFNIEKVFANLPDELALILICNFHDEAFFNTLSSFSKTLNLKIVIDIIHHFTEDGNWYENKKADFEVLVNIANKKAISIGVNASLYQNSGANIVQQISYSLAHVNEYLNALENTENKKTSSHNYLFTFAIGSNYFFEIAKIRAFRHLIHKLFKEYKSNSTFEIILEPTLRNKTIYDYNVNMLRTTTESMAAMLCGANYISNVAYDSIYHRSNEFGSRIARNQLLILKEESYFDKEHDSVKGTYYIEQLTYEIATKALTIFKDIEKNGGFLNQLQEGTIQRKIEENANKEQALFNNGELILLGTNKYPNSNDKMSDNLELYPFIKTKPRKTIIKPIIAKRLAEKLEKERLEAEK